jgi:ABC-type transport system involved in cytochrome c biogenesis permease component
MSFLKKLYLLLQKDFLVELRRSYEIISIIAFPIVATVIFSILNPQASTMNSLSFILIISLLATLFITTTSFIREYEKTTIYYLRSLPLTAATLFTAKYLYTFFIVLLVTLATTGSMVIFSGFLEINISILALLLLYTANLAAISSFVSALTMYSEGKYVLIPLITTVYSFPIILLSSSVINKLSIYEEIYWELSILGLHLIAFMIFAVFLSEIIIEE